MSVSGTVASASDSVLTEVEVAILDAADQTVQSAEAAPTSPAGRCKNLDSQIKFGELPEGAYTYMVFLTDSNGQIHLLYERFHRVQLRHPDRYLLDGAGSLGLQTGGECAESGRVGQ